MNMVNMVFISAAVLRFRFNPVAFSAVSVLFFKPPNTLVDILLLLCSTKQHLCVQESIGSLWAQINSNQLQHFLYLDLRFADIYSFIPFVLSDIQVTWMC